MEKKIVYLYDDKNYFKTVLTLDDTDRSPSGRWNVPARCVEIAPPEEKEGFKIKWNGTAWEYEEEEKDPEPLKPTFKDLKARALSYQYRKYEDQKHAIAWLEDGSGYGFDTGNEDQNNWQVALTLMENDKTYYKVYTDKNNLEQKAFLEVTRTQMMEAGNIAKAQQYAAYAGFEQVKAEIEKCTTEEELKPYMPLETA